MSILNQAPDAVSKRVKGVVKSINEKKYTADMKMSDETKDRDGEIIMLDAWSKHLPAFLKHPVLLDSHRMGNNEDILGKYANVEVIAGDGLLAKAVYFVDEEKKNTPLKEKVRWAWVLVLNDLAAFSVRFIPYKSVMLSEMSSIPDGLLPAHILEQAPYRIYTECELVECSQVTVPSNPNALLRSIDEFESKGSLVELSVAKGVFDKGLLRLPKKTFIIGSVLPESGMAKDSLLIRCSFDAAELSRIVETSKATGKPVDGVEVSRCMEFARIDEHDNDDSAEAVTELSDERKNPAASLSANEQGDLSADTADVDITEAELKSLSELITVKVNGEPVDSTIESTVDGVTAEDLEHLGKCLSGISTAAKAAGAPVDDELDDEESATFKRCLDIFGHIG